jgi:hypothetical protein
MSILYHPLIQWTSGGGMFSLSLIMEFENGILQFGAFFSATLGIFVLFVG